MADNTLSFERLLDWIDGRLSPEEAALIEEQLANSNDQADAEWLAAFRRLSQEIVLAPLPSSARASLAARFRQYAENRSRAAEERPSFIQRVLAVLTFDSAQQPALVGLRSDDTAQVRQLIYSVEVADLVINIQPRPQDARFDLLGQLLPKRDDFDPTTCTVHLHNQHRTIDAVDVPDELGEFAFAALPHTGNIITINASTINISLPLPDLGNEK